MTLLRALALATCLIARGAGSAVLAAEMPPPGVQEAPAGPGLAERDGSGIELDLSDRVPAWTQYEVLGIALWQYGAAFLFILAGLALKKLSGHLFTTKIIPWLKRTPYALDDLIATAASGPGGMLFLLLGLFGAFAVLPLPTSPNVSGFVFGVLKVLIAADVLWFLFRLVDAASDHLVALAGRTESKLDDQLVPVIRKALKATIGIIGFVWVAQLLGYSVSGLIAGLGIGGLAVALALQDTLGNFFGSVFIFLGRPFTVGDWIKMGDVEGIVEDIGFRSTRIRTWPATLVSVPNKTVAAATIDNWSKMPKRRVMQTIGVTYDTTAPQMEEAVAGIRRIIENDEGVDQEFMLVSFTDFGESSLNILVYYFTASTAWADHLATKQRINLAIMRLLKEMGLSVAFPTRTVHLQDNCSSVGSHAERDQR
ncbi:MAG: mechanosensitive ion channel family protein [Candidatus Brocadiae bacterium]|nr:mechanosensitive ion channel family protein [Candidatus Brocadiia bacterium]